MKSHYFLYLIALVFFTDLACSPGNETKSKDRPNILFIMTDQQPLSCTSLYGNSQIKTPFLDQLEREGVVLENFYISTFPCSPSRASILSGRYLHHHNVSTNNILYDTSIPNLGTILSSNGYETGYFGKAHLGGSMYVGRTDGDGIDYLHETDKKDQLGEEIKDYWHHNQVVSDSGWAVQKTTGGPGEDAPQLGFNTWEGGWKQYKNWLLENGQKEFAELAGNHDDLQSAPEGQLMYSKLGEEFHMANFFSGKTIDFIESSLNAEKSWAAVLSYFGPHLPVAPPQPWDDMYSMESIPLPDNLVDSLENKPKAQHKPHLQYKLGQWSEDQYRDYIRRYWGYSSYIDSQMGRVFQALKDNNQWDNTLIIFTTDHGDMVGAHGMIFKLEANAYEELFHVPAVIKIPGLQSKTKRMASFAASIDWLPTILEAAQIDPPQEIDGKSLIPHLEGRSPSHRNAVFSEVHPPSASGKTIMCRSGDYKYVYHWATNDVDELYDLKNDPGELNNLFVNSNFSTLSSDLRMKIIEWAKTSKHQYAHIIEKKHIALAE